jgi:hypothetical protein
LDPTPPLPLFAKEKTHLLLCRKTKRKTQFPPHPVFAKRKANFLWFLQS